jgi:hypothetical protein
VTLRFAGALRRVVFRRFAGDLRRVVVFLRVVFLRAGDFLRVVVLRRATFLRAVVFRVAMVFRPLDRVLAFLRVVVLRLAAFFEAARLFAGLRGFKITTSRNDIVLNTGDGGAAYKEDHKCVKVLSL